VNNPVDFARLGEFILRRYQRGVMEAVCRSALERQGRSFVVLFPRQSGKNELQAQIEAFLLYRLRFEGAEMVKVSPTWKPQSQNAMRRLERVLRANLATRDKWSKESGYIYSIGRARILFLSGAPETNIVGATASTLLEVDEAQDVEITKFDRDIAPMAASTDATRVFWGTAWTSLTLLARELEAARRIDLSDRGAEGPTAFVLTADDVAAEVPAYGRYVARQVKRLGRQHPLVRTQYYSETIDGQGGLFPPWRVHKMVVEEAPAWEEKGLVYALLLDVGGEETQEAGSLEGFEEGPPSAPAGIGNQGRAAYQPALWPLPGLPGEASAAQRSGGRRDATALTVVAVELAGLRDPDLRAPVYHPVERRLWVGTAHSELYGEIRAVAAAYRARKVVVDATGVGAGLASFLERALPGKVTRFLFSAASKSQLGWNFISLVDAGRWVERRAPEDALQRLFLQQLAACQFEVLPGPQQTLRWGVPETARDPLNGALLHDDLLISAALSSELDRQDWRAPATGGREAGIVQGKDPLEGMKGF